MYYIYIAGKKPEFTPAIVPDAIAPLDEPESMEMADETDYDVSVERLEDADVEDFLKGFGHFLNTLASKHYVSLKVLECTTQELKKMSQLNLSHVRAAVLASLQEKGVSDEVQQLVMSSIETMPIISACDELSTSRRIERFITRQFKYVQPQTIQYGDLQFSYASVTQILLNVLNDKTFKRDSSRTSSTILRDIKDGDHYKENPYFVANPDAYILALYSDGVEVTNPLGASKGKHKLVKFYVSIIDFEKHERSQIDHLFPVLTINSITFKKLSQEQVLRPLMNDLLELEAGVQTGTYRYVRLFRLHCRRFS